MHPFSLPSIFCRLYYNILRPVSFCNFSLRFLAFCNIVEFVLCWRVLTIRISESSLLCNNNNNTHNNNKK
jgi:hypothetical protein